MTGVQTCALPISGLLEKQKSAGGFSLSSGQTRYDAQGNVIARSAPRVSTTATVKTNRNLTSAGFTSTEAQHISQGVTRSEERRVGKECRSRWSPYH